jgi:hypothetical protein
MRLIAAVLLLTAVTFAQQAPARQVAHRRPGRSRDCSRCCRPTRRVSSRRFRSRFAWCPS